MKAKLHERFRLKIKKLRRRYEADREKLLRLMRVECENILVESQKVLFQYGELLKSKGQENGQSFGKKSKRRARSEPFPEQQFPDSAVRVVNDLDVAASFCHDESDFDIEKSAVFLHSNQNTTANSLLFSSHDGSVSSFSREKKRNNNMG